MATFQEFNFGYALLFLEHCGIEVNAINGCIFDNKKCGLDIIGKWEEPISEEDDDERLTIAESKELMHDVVELKTKLLDSKKELINKACEIFKDALVSLARENRIDCDTIGKNMKIFKEALEEQV